MRVTWRQARKGIIAAIGGLLQAANLGLLPADVKPWVGVVIAAAVAAGVYSVPNDPQDTGGRPAA